MPEAIVALTPLHYLYLLGVAVILTVMILRRDTPAVCVAFLFVLGLAGLGSVSGAISAVFTSILYAAKEFMEIIATIALVTALSKCLMELGSDSLLMTPLKHVMKTPAVTWWILGFTMLLFSFFLWPSPSVALVGAIMLPIAVCTGLTPLAAAMAINLFGHGIALSCDFIIQGAPAISASSAGITASQLISEGLPVFLVMAAVTVLTAFFLNRNALLSKEYLASKSRSETPAGHTPASGSEPAVSSATEVLPSHTASKAAFIMAVLTPIAFLFDIVFLTFFHVSGGEATSLVSGTAVLLMCIGAVLGFRGQFPEKVTGYVTEGFLFAIRIFAPVILIGAFFFLGGAGIESIMGITLPSGGIMNDWALWMADHAPLNRYIAAFIEMAVGALTGLDGSGFSGLPLTGALAQTFGLSVGASVPVLAALGQITAVYVGGGTIVPWGLIPVAAICDVSPIELAAKNLVPVLAGFAAAFMTACFLL